MFPRIKHVPFPVSRLNRASVSGDNQPTRPYFSLVFKSSVTHWVLVIHVANFCLFRFGFSNRNRWDFFEIFQSKNPTSRVFQWEVGIFQNIIQKIFYWYNSNLGTNRYTVWRTALFLSWLFSHRGCKTVSESGRSCRALLLTVLVIPGVDNGPW